MVGRSFAPYRAAFAIVTVLALIAMLAVAMVVLRRQLVEPEALAQSCLAGLQSWQCTVREWLVFGFTRNAFGITSLIAALLAIVSQWRWLALLAVIAGVAGAVLYRFELSGVGLLLGALVLVRGILGEEQRAEQDQRQ